MRENSCKSFDKGGIGEEKRGEGMREEREERG